MALKAGTCKLTSSSGKLCVHTFKEGFLSVVAHDLLIEVTQFTVNLTVPDAGTQPFSVDAEIQANSLKVVCAMKEGRQQPDTLKTKDKADIEEATSKDVLHPAKFPTICFRSTDVQGKTGGYHVKGELTLHGTTRPVEFDVAVANDNDVTGKITLSQKDFGIKPYKALLGTLKVKNELDVAFNFKL